MSDIKQLEKQIEALETPGDVAKFRIDYLNKMPRGEETKKLRLKLRDKAKEISKASE